MAKKPKRTARKTTKAVKIKPGYSPKPVTKSRRAISTLDSGDSPEPISPSPKP